MFILDFGHSKQSSVYLTEHDFLIYPEFKRKFYFNEYEIVNRNREDWNQVLNTYSSYFSYFENIFSLIMNNSWLTKADSDNSLNRETRTARKMKENMVKNKNSLIFLIVITISADDPYYCGLRARIPNFAKSKAQKEKESKYAGIGAMRDIGGVGGHHLVWGGPQRGYLDNGQ